MEDNKNAIEKIVQETKDLLEDYVKLFQLKIAISLTKVISIIVIVSTLGTVLAFISLFASISLAYFLSDWLMIKLAYCFLIIAGLYLLFFMLVVKARRGIQHFIFKVVEKIINHPKS